MTEFATLLQQGNAWLFVPSAIALGALHGLEPGHSKTMMAAFIVAVRGTVTQAVLLGLSATLSHTAVVWAVALAGLYFGRNWNAASSEPYFQLASGVIILVVAAWMLWRTLRDRSGHHDHHHAHDEVHRIATPQGTLELEIHEEGVPPRFRLSGAGASTSPARFSIETIRPDGQRQQFALRAREGFLESERVIPEPHAFTAVVSQELAGQEDLRYEVVFEEHDPTHEHGFELAEGEHADAHERAHAEEIRRRFANRQVTTGQIVVFGLTGGLIPCPASITVLLLCLQLKQFTLGAALVLCFSIGLALTMVASGTLAALSVKHVSRRWSGFGTFARNAPVVSALLIAAVGVYVGFEGAQSLQLV